MSTLTIPRDRLAADLRPGDQIVAIDYRPVNYRVAGVAHTIVNATGGIRLHNGLGSGTEWNLYPDTHVSANVTVERETPKPPPVAETAPQTPLTTSDYQVGDPVLVFAWGQYRHGKVTKIGRTRLTIEHRRNASGARHERTFVLGEIVRSWEPSPWTPGCWLPTMANDQRGREHIGMPPSVPMRPRREEAAVAAPEAAPLTGADEKRVDRFAGRFLAEADGQPVEPTDENLAAAFANTVKPIATYLYPAVRERVNEICAERAAQEGTDS